LSGGDSSIVVCYGGGGREIYATCGGVVFSRKHFRFCTVDAVTVAQVVLILFFEK